MLIAGKGHETYQFVGDKILPFDDVKVARECIGRAVGADPSQASVSSLAGSVSQLHGAGQETGRESCFM